MARPTRTRKADRDLEPAEGRGKVFWTGRSQAVRLPKAFRVSTSEVAIRREGSRLVLEPLEVERDAMGWPTAFWRLAGSAADFDLGDRRQPHERGDVLAERHRRR
jgi:virulence-associated protein VagC